MHRSGSPLLRDPPFYLYLVSGVSHWEWAEWARFGGEIATTDGYLTRCLAFEACQVKRLSKHPIFQFWRSLALPFYQCLRVCLAVLIILAQAPDSLVLRVIHPSHDPLKYWCPSPPIHSPEFRFNRIPPSPIAIEEMALQLLSLALAALISSYRPRRKRHLRFAFLRRHILREIYCSYKLSRKPFLELGRQ
jgi:hypothetical protein